MDLDEDKLESLYSAINNYYLGRFAEVETDLNNIYVQENSPVSRFFYTMLAYLTLTKRWNDISTDLFNKKIKKIEEELTQLRLDFLPRNDHNISLVSAEAIIGLTADLLLHEEKAIIHRDPTSRNQLQERCRILNEAIDFYQLLDSIEEVKQDKKDHLIFLLSYIAKILCLFSPIDPAKVMSRMEAYLEITELLSSKTDQVVMYRNMGIQAHRQGKIDNAELYFTKAFEIAQELDLDLEIFGLLNNLGVVSRVQSKYEQATKYYTKALEMTNIDRLADQRGLVLNNLGAIHFYKNNLDKALEYYFKALNFYNTLPDTRVKASTLDNIGETYYYQGQYNAALSYYEMSYDIRKKLDLKDTLSTSLDNIGHIYRDRGQIDEALEVYQKAYSIRKEVNNPIEVAKSYHNLAMIYTMKSETSKAITYLAEIPKIWDDVGNKIERLKALFDLFMVYYDFDTSIENFQFYMDEYQVLEEINQLHGEIINTDNSIPPKVRHIKELIEIINLERSERQRNKFLAIKRLEDLLPELSYDFNLYYRFSLLLFRLLVFELRVFYERQTRKEIWNKLSALKYKAQEQRVFPKIFQIGLLEAEMYVLELELSKAENLLVQLVFNSEEFGLDNLHTQIRRFYSEFIEKKEDLLKLKKDSATIREILARSSIGTTLEKLTDQTVEEIDQDTYRPKMLLLVDLNRGVSIHARALDSNFQTNENLIGAILSAISSFMEETFHSEAGLHRIEYGENFALFSQEKNILFCHLLSGSSDAGLKKLLQFKREVMSDAELWTILQTFSSTVRNSILKRLDEIIYRQF